MHNASAAAWLGRLSNYARLGATKVSSLYKRGQATLDRPPTRLKVATPLALGSLAYIGSATLEYNVLRDESLSNRYENPDKCYATAWDRKCYLGLGGMATAYAIAFPATRAALLGLGGLVTVSQYTKHSPVPKIVKDMIIRQNMAPRPTTEEQVLQGWE
jgi:hypothetical protein